MAQSSLFAIKESILLSPDAIVCRFSKLTHEKEKIPIGEAKWNKPKEKALPSKATGVVTSIAVTKIHAKIHQVEHEKALL